MRRCEGLLLPIATFICCITDNGHRQRFRTLEGRWIDNFRVGVLHLCDMSNQPSFNCT